MNKLNKRIINSLIAIGVTVLLLGSVFFTQYWINTRKDECISNPLVYGAKELTKSSGYEFVGAGYFIIPGGNSPRISWNSTSMSLINLE